MRTKDQLLLEQAYEQILKRSLIKEDPDECIIGTGSFAETVYCGSGGDVTFGFCNIGSKPFIAKSAGPTVQFEGFDDSNFGKLLTSTEETHDSLARSVFRIMSQATKGKITFLDNVTIAIDDKNLVIPKGHVIDLSDPTQRADKRTKAYLADIDELEFNSRLFLEPSGRVWVKREEIKEAYGNDIDSILSFWAEKEKVTPSHYQQLIAEFKLVPKNTMVEFLGDAEPSTRLDACLQTSSNAEKPKLSKQEQEEREKRKADSLAKVHAAAATGTKDKDVQQIIDQRKKAMSDRESQLRAAGIRPSLATRQQAMTSESLNN